MPIALTDVRRLSAFTDVVYVPYSKERREVFCELEETSWIRMFFSVLLTCSEV